ncbi:MAG: ATP-binding protein [Spirochaetota bacterium]
MIIAVASGKGGTGKTTLSAALAQYADDYVSLLDCDVEEPNADIFFSLSNTQKSPVSVDVPVIDSSRCSGCGKCSAFCRFNAIAAVGTKPLVFPDMCHSCGGCMLICPEKAISWRQEEIGTIETGRDGKVSLVKGTLSIGHAMAPPLIRAVKKKIPESGLVIIDSPPGTSCPMITAVRDSDFVILVTEPTPFGLHDLALAVETVRALKKPFGVVINRSDSGDGRVRQFCSDENIALLLEIPEDRRIAQAYSSGSIQLNLIDGMAEKIKALPAAAAAIAGGAL